MKHPDEEQLILYYYGEAEDPAGTADHLAGCAGCRESYGGLQRVLNIVGAAPVPERDENYGHEVWRRLEPALGRSGFGWMGWLSRLSARRMAFAAAMAVMLVAAFLAGRYSPSTLPQQPVLQVSQGSPDAQQVRDRVLLVAVGDYLERSQMVLVELVNTRVRGLVDIRAEQERAADLVTENRLYRQTAASTGENAVAGVLDELERVLLDIARSPSKMSGAELQRIRERIEAEGILFKIRVVGSNVKEREENAAKTQL